MRLPVCAVYVMRLGAAHHALAPPVRDDGLRGFCAGPVVAIEGSFRKRAIELRTIGRELRLQSVEHFLGEAVRIGRCLQHQRRHRADQGRLRHAAFAMPSQIMRHLAAAGGVADVDSVLQIEMRRQGRKVVCIVIHVVAITRLRGPAMLQTADAKRMNAKTTVFQSGHMSLLSHPSEIAVVIEDVAAEAAGKLG
jgi:hypothetical protein